MRFRLVDLYEYRRLKSLRGAAHGSLSGDEATRLEGLEGIFEASASPELVPVPCVTGVVRTRKGDVNVLIHSIRGQGFLISPLVDMERGDIAQVAMLDPMTGAACAFSFQAAGRASSRFGPALRAVLVGPGALDEARSIGR
ncbi:MAG: hypothetical protein HY698_18370 [Deltaproteobacteria bacterium]|nr:hypothetical protein [Deltaproteobacteria bacterium]